MKKTPQEKRDRKATAIIHRWAEQCVTRFQEALRKLN